MAQNITLLGASYTAVPAVTLPKTGGGTARFSDASVTTAVESDVAEGKIFLLADGSIGTGTASGGGPTYENIIPEQTITVSTSGTRITNNTDVLIDGETYVLTIDGESKTVQAAAQSGGIICWYTYGQLSFETYNGLMYFGVYNSSLYGEHTIKVDHVVEGSGGGSSSTNPLYGKIAAFTGDSLCYGANYTGGYAKIIGEENGMTIQNIGVSEGTIVSYSDRFCISESIDELRSDADYVILEGGINDAWYGPEIIPLGTLSSGYNATLDKTTFAGAFEYMLKTAIARFTTAKIGYIFPHRVRDEFSAPSGAYYLMAKSALEKWGIPYFDGSTLIPPLGYIDDLSSYVDLSGHPNEAGYRTFYVPKIVAFMQTMLTDKTLISKTMTANGTYLASDDDADGYDSVTVNVSSGGSGLQMENIIPEQTINCTIAIGQAYANIIQTYVETPIVGTYYLVTLDNIEYIARAYNINANLICIGDIRVQQGAEYVEFPFEIMKEDIFYLVVKTSGECTLKVDKILSFGIS